MPSGAAKLAITLLLTADIKGFESKMRKLDASMKGTLKKANEYGLKLATFGASQQKAGLANMAKGVAALAPIAYVANQAVKLEAAVADITKVLPETVKVGSKGFLKLEKSAAAVGYELGRSAEDTAGLMASLAAGGVAQQDLERTAKLAGQIGVAFDVTGLQAGQAFQAIRNAMQLNETQVMQVMNANNALANNFGSTIDASARLMEFMMSSGASVASSLKTSGADIQAFANSFMVIGVDSKVATTSIERFSKAILTNDDLSKRFAHAGGGMKGIMSILQAARNSGDAAKFLLERGVGSYSTQLAAVANAMNSDKGLTSQLKFLRKPGAVDGSVQQEFDDKAATTAFRMEQLRVGASNIAVSLGTTLMPALSKLVEHVTPILKAVTDWLEKNPKLAESILKVMAASASLRIGVGALQFAWGGTLGMVGKVLKNGTRTVKSYRESVKWIKKTNQALKDYRVALAISRESKRFAGTPTIFQKVGESAKKFGKTIGIVAKGIGRSFAAMGKFLLTNPIILIITGIAVAAFLIIKYWKPIKAFFIDLWDKIKEIFGVAWDWIKNMFLNYTLYGLIIKHWGAIRTFFSKLWDDVLGIFKRAWDKIANSPIGKLIGKLISGTGSILKGIGNLFSGPDNNRPNPFSPGPLPQPVPVRGGSTYNSPFNMTVNLSGGASQADADKFGRAASAAFEKHFNQMKYNQQRRAFD